MRVHFSVHESYETPGAFESWVNNRGFTASLLSHIAMKPTVKKNTCLCGSSKAATYCCQPYLEGIIYAPTAEALMRSRYVAYALGAEPYLLATWHSSTRPASLNFDSEPPLNWIGLTIKRHELLGKERAIVEFVARYKVGGRAYKLHETSRFIHKDGHWLYLDGDIED